MGAVVGNVYYNTDSGFAVPGGLLDQLVNPAYAAHRAQMQVLSQIGNDNLLNPAAGSPPAAAPAPQPQSNSQPVASSTGFSPEVASYITSSAKARGINPNVPLRIFGAESKMNPAAAGDPDAAGQSTSFGVPQLHYGSPGGGPNSVAGMGDDFTKATGLDARDPKNWKATVDYALDQAAKNGWGPWHAAQKLGIPNMAGIGGAAQDAGSSDDAAPSSTHPYAPTPQSGLPAGTRVAGPGAPADVSPTQGQGQAPSAIDPTLNGLLKGPWVGNPGGYISALRQHAAAYGTAGFTGAESAYNKQADMVERALERSETPEVKNYAVALRQGYQGTMMDFARDTVAQSAVAKLQAEGDPSVIRAKGQAAEAAAAGAEQGKAPYELVPMQPTPGGPTVMVPKSQVLASSSPMASKQPPVINQQQEALGKQVSAVPDMLRQRQITRERIDAMSNLLQTFQSGAGADQKAAAVAAVRSAGINLPDSATANPAAVEQFWKNAQANVFSQIKDQGGKVLVSEIQGFQKANANPNMQPASNAAILAQQKGLLDWQDAHDRAMIDWYHKNPYAYDASPFEMDWEKQNKPADYVASARKEIAPLGIAIPAPAQRVVGQRYAIPGKGVYRWAGSGWSTQ